ncbi:MAG: aspartate aminotransferase family protein [Alphaproteobacteria bacterium]|nr:aspartate aminotransferase family protein [Alphaproteobacteria bacterium]
MSHIFPRGSADLPQAARGDGAYIYDDNGQRWLDGSGGAAVSCLGHGDAAVRDAVKSQLDALEFAHTAFFTSEAAETLASLLVANAPGGLERVYLVSGGSEATEAAVKLARQYFIETNEPRRTRLIARRQSYHGTTLGSLSAGGHEWRREIFAPFLFDVSHVAPCYEYRGREPGESSADYARRAADTLETEINRLGAETVMAFIAEPIAGASLGAVCASEGYFRRVREICDRHGVLLILDEVMCGMGRSGRLFAHEDENIAADIVTVAKGLGGGYQPIGAMLCSAKIYDAVAGGSGVFRHGHTYSGHPVAAAAGVAVLRRILDDDLLGRVRVNGGRLDGALREAFGQHPHVGDIRGRGLFRGLEFVRDRETREPFAAGDDIHGRLKRAAFSNGLICYPGGGCADGVRGDHVLLAPPFIIDEAQIDELVSKLVLSFREVF